MPGPLSLLDRFVRLAAHGCQVACAYVEAGRDRAWFGPLSAAAWTALCSAEGDGGGFAVMARVPLLSQAGRSLGTLLVADRMGRDQLTTTQMTALDDVAALLVAALEQEHRHEHLVELTDRAARVDGILRQVSEAESCEDALTKVLKGLCGHHDAAVGRIWRLSTVDGLMQEISRFADDPVDDQSYYRQPPTAPVRAGNSMTAGSIRDNVPQTVIYSRVADPTKFVLMNAAISSGLRSQVSFPIWVEEQRFGISLAFTTEREDLNDIVADIAALANTIRPALFRKVSEERIRFMAHHDDLTQLGNRAVFNEGLAEAVRVASMGGTGLALLYLDLDGFKVVNDMRGHEVGDKLLAAVAGRLRASSREGDTVTRIGGDEFAIIHPAASQPYAATQLARRLLTAIGEPFEIDGQPVMIGVSIGIALHPTDGETPDVLQRNADAALYEAKQGGRNTVRLFDRSVAVMQQERQLIERDLKDAIEREEFTLAFQPIVASDSLRVRGLEALLRWTHPTRGSLSPGRFVPLAEQSGLIIPLGRWALHAACMEAARWRRGTCLSVNFSPLQFRQPGLALQIETVLSRTGLPPSNLDMEVTEGVLLDDSGLVMKTMHELREMGVKMTLDDFGTAYASLGYLRRFPFDRIKIDQSFIQGMCNDDATLAIVQAILSLGARLNLQVVAEGVETEQELATLRTLGCELVQGFLTGRPVPQAQLGTLAGFRPGQSRPA